MHKTNLDTEQLLELIERQALEIERLKVKIRELEGRLKKNSGNSSKPPSSDGLSKPRSCSLRKKGQKKSGGQKGHKGTTLQQSDQPDQVYELPLSTCPDCGLSLASKATLGCIKRQVFDIPPPRMEVTEYQAQVKHCSGCDKRVSSPFPSGVIGPVQYGPVIRSWALYYQHQHFIPEDRVQQLFDDLYGVKLATSTLVGYSALAHESLAEFEQAVLSLVQTAPVKHLDETGFRVSGQTQWLHVASTQRLSCYHVSPKRKSLLSGLQGTVVHDHWKPYYQLPEVRHALCNQHHLRELNAIIEQDNEVWAKRLQRWLRLALRYRHAFGEKAIPADKLERLINGYERIITAGLRYHEDLPELSTSKRRGRKKRRTGHNLLLRLQTHQDAVLLFLSDPQVPFTNNQAERDLRMMKCKQKISGGFRTVRGAEVFARIRGFISTARKQGWNVFDSIQQAVCGRVPMPV
ncbi:MAG: IS66 family transposase [Aliifodinibius sp.]|nr:IS66 family transposase [candidate division KSB1 bacterium]NIT56325.1 IS66 family transposase [Fodinibius sp.]NIU99893.1 IS66 family transposase [Phycisphaerae bacterium]NIV68627.1 IS66 family transposase [Phycisphaerae bacterium]NIY24908.1 IS66 family transposase [Fodinibius sp.]